MCGEMASEDVMDEIARLRAERDALREALKRHMLSFTDRSDTELCGGCLEPSPCPDAALAEPSS